MQGRAGIGEVIRASLLQMGKSHKPTSRADWAGPMQRMGDENCLFLDATKEPANVDEFWPSGLGIWRHGM